MAEICRARAYLVEDASKIKTEWLENVDCVAITAGASAPEHLVREVVDYFRRLGVTDIQEIGSVDEQVTFTPPPELARELARRDNSPQPAEDSSPEPTLTSVKLPLL